MKTPTNSAAEMIAQLTADNLSVQNALDAYTSDCQTRIQKNTETIALLEPVAEWSDA